MLCVASREREGSGERERERERERESVCVCVERKEEREEKKGWCMDPGLVAVVPCQCIFAGHSSPAQLGLERRPSLDQCIQGRKKKEDDVCYLVGVHRLEGIDQHLRFNFFLKKRRKKKGHIDQEGVASDNFCRYSFFVLFF